MTQDAAVILIQQQLDEVDRLNENNYAAWQTQTRSHIKKVFGQDSDEYKFIDEFHFIFGFSDTPYNNQIKNASPQVKSFLERCVDTIRTADMFVDQLQIGTTKDTPPPQRKSKIKRMFMVILTESGWAAVALVILGFVFSAGWFFGDMALRAKISTPDKSNSISGKDTSGHQNDIRKDTTHP